MALNHFQKQYIINQAQARGLDPTLVMKLVQQESGGQMDAKSSKGAHGVFQVTKIASDDVGADWNKVKTDFRSNVNAGLDVLSKNFKEFKTPELALAAYNAGAGNVRKYKGVPPFAETQNYVKNILGLDGAKGLADFQGRENIALQAAGGVGPYVSQDTMERFAKSIPPARADAGYDDSDLPMSKEEIDLLRGQEGGVSGGNLSSLAQKYIRDVPQDLIAAASVSNLDSLQPTKATQASVQPKQAAAAIAPEPKAKPQGFVESLSGSFQDAMFGSMYLESLYAKMQKEKPGSQQWKSARQEVINEVNRQQESGKGRSVGGSVTGALAGGLPYAIADMVFGTGSAEAARHMAALAKEKPKGDIVAQAKEAGEYGAGTNIANLVGMGVGGAPSRIVSAGKQAAANVLAGQAPELAHNTKLAGDPVAMALDAIIGGLPELARGAKLGGKKLEDIGVGIAEGPTARAETAAQPIREAMDVSGAGQYDLLRRMAETEANEPPPVTRGIIDIADEGLDEAPHMAAYGAAQRELAEAPTPFDISQSQRLQQQLAEAQRAVEPPAGAYIPEGIGFEGAPMGLGRGEMPSAIPNLVETQKTPYQPSVELPVESIGRQLELPPESPQHGIQLLPEQTAEFVAPGIDPSMRSQAQVGAMMDMQGRPAPQIEIPDMYRARTADMGGIPPAPSPLPQGPMRSEIPNATAESMQQLVGSGLQRPVESGISTGGTKRKAAYDSELYKPDTEYEAMQEAASVALAKSGRLSPERQISRIHNALRKTNGHPADATAVLDALTRGGQYTDKELDAAVRNVAEAYNAYDRQVDNIKCKGVI